MSSELILKTGKAISNMQNMPDSGLMTTLTIIVLLWGCTLVLQVNEYANSCCAISDTICTLWYFSTKQQDQNARTNYSINIICNIKTTEFDRIILKVLKDQNARTNYSINIICNIKTTEFDRIILKVSYFIGNEHGKKE